MNSVGGKKQTLEAFSMKFPQGNYCIVQINWHYCQKNVPVGPIIEEAFLLKLNLSK